MGVGTGFVLRVGVGPSEADLCAEAFERSLELDVEALAAVGEDLVDLLGDHLDALADRRVLVHLSHSVAQPRPEDAFPAVPLPICGGTVRLLGFRRHAQAAHRSTRRRRVDGWQSRR